MQLPKAKLGDYVRLDTACSPTLPPGNPQGSCCVTFGCFG